MTKDRELLELAAKAAGLLIGFSEGAPDEGRPYVWNGDYKTSRWWDPLTDDRDALRLAVTLEINVLPSMESASARNPSYTKWCNEDARTDPYAATRRAIVRAAAEIGRQKP
jgi:hypothetical protein